MLVFHQKYKIRRILNQNQKIFLMMLILEQLVEFFPFVKYSIFTGGEPFLINFYYDIWKKCLKLTRYNN